MGMSNEQPAMCYPDESSATALMLMLLGQCVVSITCVSLRCAKAYIRLVLQHLGLDQQLMQFLSTGGLHRRTAMAGVDKYG